MCSHRRSTRRISLALAIIVAWQVHPALADDPFQSPHQAANPTPAARNDRLVQPATHSEPLREQRKISPQNPPATKLSPPSESSRGSGRPGPLSAIFTVVGSLAVVLGLFIGVAWLIRRGLPRSAGRLPGGVVEVLGNAPLATRRQMHVLRFGNKLLLVCVSQNGVDTLAEIEDAGEVERLTKLCQQSRPAAASGFDQVFGKLPHSTAAEQTAASGGLAAMALRQKSAIAREVET